MRPWSSPSTYSDASRVRAHCSSSRSYLFIGRSRSLLQLRSQRNCRYPGAIFKGRSAPALPRTHPGLSSADHGEWRSLVAHPAGGRAAAGSNPVSPIKESLLARSFSFGYASATTSAPRVHRLSDPPSRCDIGPRPEREEDDQYGYPDPAAAGDGGEDRHCRPEDPGEPNATQVCRPGHGSPSAAVAVSPAGPTSPRGPERQRCERHADEYVSDPNGGHDAQHRDDGPGHGAHQVRPRRSLVASAEHRRDPSPDENASAPQLKRPAEACGHAALRSLSSACPASACARCRDVTSSRSA